MPFAVPSVWREPKDHIRDCYFCLVNVKCFSAKSKHGVQYPILPSAIRPVPHDGFPIPKLPRVWTTDDDVEESFFRQIFFHLRRQLFPSHNKSLMILLGN
jgi:hypothetical protein